VSREERAEQLARHGIVQLIRHTVELEAAADALVTARAEGARVEPWGRLIAHLPPRERVR
jgi:hypothetical protein